MNLFFPHAKEKEIRMSHGYEGLDGGRIGIHYSLTF